MKRLSALALVVLLAGVADAQWLEQLVSIPNSSVYLTDRGQVHFNPVNNHVYAGGGVCSGIQVLDAATRTRLGALDSAYWFSDILMCPDRQRMYVLDDDAVVVFDAAADSVVKVFPLPGHYACGAYNPVMHKAYVAQQDTALMLVFDVGPDTVLRRIDLVDGAWRVRYDSASNRIFLLPEDSTAHGITVIDCAGDTVIGHMPTIAGHRQDMVIDADGRQLYAVGRNRSTQLAEVWVYDVDSLALLDTIALPASSARIEGRFIFNPQARLLYVADIVEAPRTGTMDAEDSLILIDCATNTISKSIGFPGDVMCAAYDAQNGKLLVGVSDSSLAVLAVPDSVTARVHTRGIYALGCVPLNGDVYAGEEERVEVFSGSGDTLIKSINCSKFNIDAMVWTAAGNRLYASGEAGLTVVGPDNSVLEQLYWPESSWPEPSVPAAYLAELNSLYFKTRAGIVKFDCNTGAFATSPTPPTKWYAATFLVPGTHKLYVPAGNDSVVIYDLYVDSAVGMRARFGSRFVDNPRNGLVYGYRNETETLRVIDPRSDSLLASVRFPVRAGLLMNTTDNEIYSASDRSYNPSRRAYVFDATANTLSDSIELPEAPWAVAWYEPLNKLYAVGDSSVYVVDCRTRSVVNTVPVRTHYMEAPTTFFAPRNDKLWVASNDGIDVIQCRMDSVVAGFDIGVSRSMTWNAIDNRVYASNGWQVFVFRDDPAGVEAGVSPVVTDLALAPRSNPAVGAVRFDCAVPSPRSASLSVHDAAGRVVWTHEVAPLGRDVVTWHRQDKDGRALPAGIYFARLESGSSRVTAKVVLR